VPEYTLRIRRYDPQSDQAHHWDEHSVQMDEHHSVLDAILKMAKVAPLLDLELI
jgi:succinate dehydrogenase / fumarate reductase iron-sulfur subunit